jgi:hypothetical protein
MTALRTAPDGSARARTRMASRSVSSHAVDINAVYAAVQAGPVMLGTQ